MQFKYYDPRLLATILKEDRTDPDCEVCAGCVFTGVAPSYCFHPPDSFSEPSVQSDQLCSHCKDTVEEDGKPFHFHQYPTLPARVEELERILEMAWA
jgi:hypothetical protein